MAGTRPATGQPGARPGGRGAGQRMRATLPSVNLVDITSRIGTAANPHRNAAAQTDQTPRPRRVALTGNRVPTRLPAKPDSEKSRNLRGCRGDDRTINRRELKMMTEEHLVEDALKRNAGRGERACSTYEEGRQDARKAAEAGAPQGDKGTGNLTGDRPLRGRRSRLPGGRGVGVAGEEENGPRRNPVRGGCSSLSWGWPSSAIGR